MSLNPDWFAVTIPVQKGRENWPGIGRVRRTSGKRLNFCAVGCRGMKVGRIKRHAAQLFRRVPGYEVAVRRIRSHAVAILMYHGVVAEPLEVFNWCQLSQSRFEQQIRFLSQEYEIHPLREIVERVRKGLPLPERSAVITFDDGYRSVYTSALPILTRYQIPFTVFLVTSLIGGSELIWTDRLFCRLSGANTETINFAEQVFPVASRGQRSAAYYTIGATLKRMDNDRKDMALAQLLKSTPPPALASVFRTLNWDEIQQLAGGGLADFGSHSHTHPILSRCDPECQRREIRQSRDILYEHLGVCDLFAYPNGRQFDYTGETKSLLRELGFQAALTTVPGFSRQRTDLFELHRIGIGADMTQVDFECLMRAL